MPALVRTPCFPVFSCGGSGLYFSLKKEQASRETGQGLIPKFALLEQSEIQEHWKRILERLESQFGQKPDLNGVLFIIGIRELGMLPEKKFTKEEKVSLMHIAVCKVLSYSGYYELNGMDQDGWPIWENRIPLPFVSVFEQETMLRRHVVEYFLNEQII